MKDYKEISALREKAEFMITKSMNIDEATPSVEVIKLLHELEVYQIELEMQNEALFLAKENAETISRKYKALYDLAPMGYFTLDRDGIIIDVNQTGEIMLGKEKSVLIGNNYEDFIKPDAQKYFKNFMKRVYECDSHVTCELKVYSTDNKEIFVYMEGIVTTGDNCLIAAIDITERRKNEKALYKSEARLQELNATKDKLFSIIGHDLRGPFTSIVGFSEILLEQIHKKNFDNVERITDIIHNSSLQAMDLLSNLLEWGRLQTGKIKFSPTLINLNNLINDVFALLNASIQHKSIVVSKSVNPELEIFADLEMLSNVFRNIISNAIKFTPTGGTIMIDAKDQAEGLLVTISDTGVGIEASDINKLFRTDTAFSKRGTQNEIGSGLGLLLSKEFVEKHGGELWVESEPGIGSMFFFTIPKENNHFVNY